MNSSRFTPFNTLHHLFFFGSLFIGVLFFGYTISPFLLSIFWATVFAIVLRPVFMWCVTRGVSETLASLCTILIFLTCIIAPFSFVGTLVAEEAVRVYTTLDHETLSAASISHRAAEQLARLGVGGEDIDGLATQLISAASGAASWVKNTAVSFGTATAVTLVKAVIMLYLLFYFLRDGTKIVDFLHYLIPIGRAREEHLFSTFASVTRALFKGTLVVAVVQGFIGMCMFFAFMVPHAFLLGALMTLVACIPGVGPAVVWLPVALWLMATGHVYAGIAIVFCGTVIIGVIDNILRPMLVGRETSLPDPVIFISILGGIASFGIPGVILGPIAAGLCFSLLEMFTDEYGHELENH